MTHPYDSILALSYMEANPGDFPMSNVNSALQKISQSITPEALEKVSLIQNPLYPPIFGLPTHCVGGDIDKNLNLN